MRGKITRVNSKQRTNGATDFKRLRAMPDSRIDYSDIPRLNKSFWKTASSPCRSLKIGSQSELITTLSSG
jgi:hypothetical protein